MRLRQMISPETHLIIVAPHPDDETIGLGGTIHDHICTGGTVEIIAVTDGEAADDEADEVGRVRLATTRHSERQHALSLLGAAHAEVVRLGLPDREVAQHKAKLTDDLRQRFAAAQVDRCNCLVALPWRGDPHPDHEASARAGIEAALSTGLSYFEVPIWATYERKKLPAHRISYQPVTTEGQKAKRHALQAFTSQIELLPGDRGPVLPSDFLTAFDQPHEVILR